MTGESRQPGIRISIAVAVAAVIWPIAVTVLVSVVPAAPRWLGPASFLFYCVLAVRLQSRFVVPFTLSGVVVFCAEPHPGVASSYTHAVVYLMSWVFGCALGGFVLALCCEFIVSEFHQWKRMGEASEK